MMNDDGNNATKQQYTPLQVTCLITLDLFNVRNVCSDFKMLRV